MNLKKPLKIAYIVRKYSTSGGTEKHIYIISKKLAELGNKIFIICSKKETEPPNSNIHIFNLPCNFPSRIIKTFLFYFLTKKINLKNYDIVQGAGKVVKHDIYRAGGGFHKLYLKYQKKREKYGFYDKMVINIEEKIFNVKNTKLIISVSNFIKNEIVKEFNYPKDKIIVLHNCVDIDFFKPSDKPYKNKMLTCIFVANDYKLKGLKNIIEALKFIDNVKLKIIGNDSDKPFIKFAKENKVSDKIEFFGEKKGKDLLKLYNEADILIHPTYYDPFSNVCLEALSCGLPVITTKINGASEIIENFKDGIVINSPDNIDSLIDAINFFKNKNNLFNTKINARKKAEKYSIDNYVERLLDLYYNFINSSKV